MKNKPYNQKEYLKNEFEELKLVDDMGINKDGEPYCVIDEPKVWNWIETVYRPAIEAEIVEKIEKFATFNPVAGRETASISKKRLLDYLETLK